MGYATATDDITQIDIDELSHECVNNTSHDYDWSEGYPETWEYREVEDCDECGEPAICHGRDRTCSNEKCSLYDEAQDTDYSEGPMMNYYYELPECPEDHKVVAALDGLPLCVVDFAHESVLALTGGGMDLSWEICEAHMRLGYLPPTHFAGLPRMAGRGTSERDKKIVAACRASIASAKRALDWPLRELDQIEGG